MSYHTVGLIVFASCSTILAIQRYVFPCGRVALWFQVGKQLRAGDCRADVAFELLEQVMPALNRTEDRQSP
jgi:hypothetical protein